MKKIFTLCFLLFALVVRAEWTDVTAFYLTNTDFSNGKTGWKGTFNSANSGGYWRGNDVNYGCMEVYNNEFDIYQTIANLPQGHYRLTVSAFHRAGGYNAAWSDRQGGSEMLTTELYAGDDSKTLVSLFDWGFTSYLDGTVSPGSDGKYYPDNMYAASQAFAQGGYKNTMEFNHAGGEISIGVRNSSWIESCWTIFTGFKLEKEGTSDAVLVNSISLTASKSSIQVGETTTITASVTPSNATLKDVKWSSSDPFVLTVGRDGTVKGRGQGSATVTATAQDGSNVSKSVTISVTKSESTDTRTWSDVTESYITNPDFITGNAGWTNNYGTVRASCQEFYNYRSINFYQTIQNLPVGHYRISALGFHRNGDNAWNLYLNNDQEVGATLFVLGDKGNERKFYNDTFLCSYYSQSFEQTTTYNWLTPDGGSHWFPNTMETADEAFQKGGYMNRVEFDVEEEGMSVTLGIYMYNGNYVQNNWCIFSHFRLETTANVVQATDITLSLPKTSLQVDETMQATAQLKPTNVSQTSVKWTSSDPRVATVDDNGLVTAVGTGTASITVSTIDGSNLSASKEITVRIKEGEWIDVTNIFINNPGYVNNSGDGWTVETTGSTDVNYNAMENYNGRFNIYQQLSGLPKGKYRLSVQAFYRAGQNLRVVRNGYSSSYSSISKNFLQYYDNEQNDTMFFYGAYREFYWGRENITARLYAGDNSKPLASVYSDYVEESINGSFGIYDYQFDGNGQYVGNAWTCYPNSMWSGSYLFGMDKYVNTLEFDSNGGDLTIGLRNDDYIDSDWCLFTNWKLMFSGEVKKITNLQLTAEKNELVVGETMQITPVYTPADALQKQLKWTSSNEQVVSVSDRGLLTALSEGTSTITVSTLDGSSITRTMTITVVRSIATESSLVINEIMPSNVDDFVSPAYNFDGWVEFYNTTNKAVELGGLYLSNDPTNLTMWKIPASLGVVPAKGFKTVWFDSNDIAQTNAPFKLNVSGATLYVSDAQGKLLITQPYIAAGERNSYARTTDGGNTWSLTSQPTPGATNVASSFATEQLAAPVIDADSKLFTSSFTATVAIPSGAKLRYTLDGSVPTLTNGETSTTGIFQIDGTTNLRLRFFAEGKLASTVTTRSYIFNDLDYILPVVSVVANDDHLYGDELGALVRGTNGKVGHGQSSPCNWNMDWQRPVNFSYLTADGQMAFNQDVNLEMSGGWSRANSMKSFKLRANKEFGGDKNLLYPFFSDKPYVRNKTLLIRNGGNDEYARFRDPAMQYVAQTAGMNLDLQSYEPVHEFINGRYIGVLNMREANNKDYAYSNYGWDDDEIDQFKIEPDSGYLQKCGTRDAFNDLVNLSRNAKNKDTYQEIRRLLDIDAYANYMALEFFVRNWDWPQNNVKGFRNRADGKFRFVVFDLDNIFTSDYGDGKASGQRVPYNTFFSKEYYTFDKLYPVELGRITDSIKFVTIFKNMIKNVEFRRQFVDAVSMMGGSVYEPSRVETIINQLASRVYPAMQLGRGESPWSTANSIINNMNGRARIAMQDLCAYDAFDLSIDQARKITLGSDIDEATLLVNGMKVPTGRFDGYLFSPAKLKAVAPAGYVFQGWKSNITATSKTLLAKESVWKYYSQGSLDDVNWQSTSYDDSSWNSGKAPLGYNNPNYEENTVFEGYTKGDEKIRVFYFRKTVNLDNAPSADTEIYLDYVIDDGFIIYVNGTEAGRYNMRDDNTYAKKYAGGNPDTGTLQLSSDLFKKGNNTIAVAVYNESLNSSDILWDGAIRMNGAQSSDIYSAEAEIDMPDANNVSLTASFRSLTAAERSAQKLNPVRINELSAANTVFMNEYYKKNDWVELYNTTDKEYDVEGMFLTDNKDKPEKYQITKASTGVNTKIPAHGYLLVWCDKLETTDRALHAPYKLAAEGGYLMLTAADKTWTDTLTYSLHTGNQTVGRYPDGANAVYTMDVPTIAATNMLTSYMVREEQQGISTGIETKGMLASANGFRICYGGGQLLVKAEDDGLVSVDIYTPDGRLVDQTVVSIQGGAGRVNVSHLPIGFYVARATDADNTCIGCKFMR